MRLLNNHERPKMLVTLYRKPEMIRGIYVPEAYATDFSRSLWEVHQSTPEADEALGMTLEPEWILVTAPNSGIRFYGMKTEEGREVFLLATSSVVRVIPWTSADEGVSLARGKVVVRPADVEVTEAGVILMRDETPETRRGVVMESASDEVAPGDVILFSRYAGVEMETRGERFVVLDEESVLALVLESRETTAA